MSAPVFFIERGRFSGLGALGAEDPRPAGADSLLAEVERATEYERMNNLLTRGVGAVLGLGAGVAAYKTTGVSQRTLGAVVAFGVFSALFPRLSPVRYIVDEVIPYR